MAIKDLKWNPPAGGNAGYWSGTFIVDNTGDSIDTFRLPIGNTTGDITVKLDGIDENLFPGAEKSINVIDCITWSLSATPSVVTEGQTVTLNLATNAPDDTYTFNITGTGIVGDELSGGGISWDGGTSKYTGVFTKSGGTVTPITLNVLTDADGSPENLTVQLENGKATPITVTINELVQTWSLSTTPSVVTEGNPVTVILNTANVPDGLIPFSIKGATRSGHIQQTGGVSWDIPSSEYKGNFNLSSGTASITLNTLDDGIADGPLTLTISLDNGNDSVNVTINDPSAPAVCGSQIASWSNGQPNSITTSGILTQTDVLGNYAVKGWDAGGTLYLPELDGVGFSNSQFYAKLPDKNTLGYFAYITSPITTDFYYEHNGVCYKGEITADGVTTPSNPQILTVVP